MSLEDRHLEATRKNVEAGMQRSLPEKLPEYHTVEPRLYPSTSYIAALDGTDQQIFCLPYDRDRGIAAWGVLYIECDPNNPQAIYRDGPNGGFFITEDLFYYHLTMDLPDGEQNRRCRNDFHTIRQTLSSARPTEPPLLNPNFEQKSGARKIAAVERATGEWIAFRSATTHQLPPGGLILKDGRFNCQIEQAASWVDELGRIATRNEVRGVAVVKSGKVYGSVCRIVREVAKKVDKAFYFIIPPEIIEKSYENQIYLKRKTLMLGGKDHADLAGIGALWTAFCPDPQNPLSFVILEFNLYDLFNYKNLATTPKTLLQWQLEELKGSVHKTEEGKTPYIWVTDLLIDYERDISQLVEPTIQELLWLCECEIARFNYPNLLGIAHHDVVLTQEKVRLLRQKYKKVFAQSDILLDELIDSALDAEAHKLHNIY